MKIKKLLALISILAVMFSLAGCVKEAEPMEYDEALLTYNTILLFEQYASVDSDMEGYYQTAGTEFEKSAVKGIIQARDNDKVGTFESYSKYTAYYNVTNFEPELVNAEFEATDESVTVTVINHAADRDVEISVKYTENAQYFIEYSKLTQQINVDSVSYAITSYYGMTVEDFLAMYGFSSIEEVVQNEIEANMETLGITKYTPEEMVVSAVYSKSELMKQAGMNTLLGMGTVFVVLIFISFIISLFKFLPALTAKKAKLPEPKKEEPKAVPVVKAEPKTEENLVNDSELVAVITAAIYAATGSAGQAVSKDKLIVRSIKRVKK
ncbi:MAG: OadG family protein [Wujia sp.]